MAPPSYAELGKQAMDILTKGYHFGLLKLDCKTNTASGIEVVSSGTSNQTSGKISGSLETKYKYDDYGLSLSESWNTDSVFTTEIGIMDKIAQGLNLAFLFNYSPQSGDKDGKIKIGYGQDNYKLNTDFTVDLAGPVVNFSAVYSYEELLLGIKTLIDTQQKLVDISNIGLHYKFGDTILHGSITHVDILGFSVFHKFNDNIDAAVQLSYLREPGEVKLGLGAKYTCENGCTFRAKINDALAIGLGFQHQIRTGITLFLSGNINVGNFSEGGHLFGVALQLDA